MAQHTPISALSQKVFRKIETSIKKDCDGSKQGPTGSLKYEWARRILNDWDYRLHAQLNERDEVFTTNRFIGKGVIWGSTHGDFEVHYDTVLKRVTNIYLVA